MPRGRTTERVVSTPGLRVAYLETGALDLPPAVALHSLMGRPEVLVAAIGEFLPARPGAP